MGRKRGVDGISKGGKQRLTQAELAGWPNIASVSRPLSQTKPPNESTQGVWLNLGRLSTGGGLTNLEKKPVSPDDVNGIGRGPRKKPLVADWKNIPSPHHWPLGTPPKETLSIS